MVYNFKSSESAAFSYSIVNDWIRDKIYSAIRGVVLFEGKKAVCRYGIEESWYNFRDKAYKKSAVVWGERYNVLYTQ